MMVGVDGSVKVLDFGLAVGGPARDSWVDDQPRDSVLSTKITQADVVLGTAGYMPPEHLMGRASCPLGDQFSFCVTLFEALYGVRPFPGKNPVELARSYAEEIRTIPEHPNRVPARLRRVLERGLSLDPADRYPSMRALLRDLDRPRRSYRRWAATAAALVGTACLSATIAIWLTRYSESLAICGDAGPSQTVARDGASSP
jgi:serine/threonine protein kinase